MISPDFRTTEVLPVLDSYRAYISANHGDSLWHDLEPEFQKFHQIRKEIMEATNHRTDPVQLRKDKDLFLELHKIQTVFNKYFSYGNQKNQVNITHTWYDSFAKTKKQSMSPLLDAISCLYNYGVSCARIACYIDLGGEGIKEASKLFQQAGWVFEHLKTLVTSLPVEEQTVDFSQEALGMLSHLMLAQAQYLFYRKASETSMKQAVLAKIVMQVAEYFRKAHELGSCNASLKSYDQGRFLNIMYYHSYYFQGIAYSIASQEEFKTANDSGTGMGKAVSYFKATAEIFEKAKSVVHLIPSNYGDNFNQKYQELIKNRDKANHENKTIYFEKEIPVDQVPKIDCQNFVKLEPQLDAISEKHPIEDKLRYIVPPQVRVLQEELKQQFQEMISQQYEINAKTEQDQSVFFQSMGLPQILHAVTATTEIPQNLWEKIEDFQKKGGIQNVKDKLSALATMRQNNLSKIQQMQGAIEEEEKGDEQLRAQFMERWARKSSAELNVQYKHQISEYQKKATMAAETDQKVEDKYNAQQDKLIILMKSRQEISSLIPQSLSTADLTQNPVVLSIKQGVEEIEKIREQRTKILDESVQKCQTYNAMEDMTLIYQQQANKGDIFENHKAQFRAIFDQLGPLDQRRTEINSMISQNMGQFHLLMQSVQQDQAKQKFYQDLDASVNYMIELDGMLNQANQFYSQFADYLTKLYQNIMDFKMTRDIEKNELLKQVNQIQHPPPQPHHQPPAFNQPPHYPPGPHQQPPPQGAYQPPYQQPQYPPHQQQPPYQQPIVVGQSYQNPYPGYGGQQPPAAQPQPSYYQQPYMPPGGAQPSYYQPPYSNPNFPPGQIPPQGQYNAQGQYIPPYQQQQQYPSYSNPYYDPNKKY